MDNDYFIYHAFSFHYSKLNWSWSGHGQIKNKWIILSFNGMIAIWTMRYCKISDDIIYEYEHFRIENQWDLPPDILVKDEYFERSYLTHNYLPNLSNYEVNIEETPNKIIIDARGSDTLHYEIFK